MMHAYNGYIRETPHGRPHAAQQKREPFLMPDNPFFSIIIPVYNAEQYICPCLDSISTQSFRNYEVILVDDGSSDCSLSLCKKRAANDSRIVVVSQQNAGTSAARNTGICYATGQYITFMDNDDLWIDQYALEGIAKLIAQTGADLIIHETFEFSGRAETANIPNCTPELASQINKMDKASAISKLCQKRLLVSAVWAKVCKKSLILEHNLFFPVGMRNEDTAWTSQAIRFSQTIAWYDCPFYAYRKGHEYAQTSKPITMSQLNDLADICITESRIIDNCEDSEALKTAYRQFLAYPYCVWMGQSALFGKSVYENDRYSKMKALAGLLHYDANPDVSLVHKTEKLIGYDNTRWLLGLYLKHKYKYVSSPKNSSPASC